jgi:hypothetical protein
MDKILLAAILKLVDFVRMTGDFPPSYEGYDKRTMSYG